MNDYVEVFVPGRLCILGEHSDWAAGYRNKIQDIEKGYAIVAGLNLGIYMKGKKSRGFSYTYQEKRIRLSYDDILHYDCKDFFAYVVASAKIMHMKYSLAGGIDVICEKMTLPMGKGLASSAAICVAIIRLYNFLYELGLSVEEEMALAYDAEISTGAMCGRMDQICAYGQGLRKICFDGDMVEVHTLKTEKEWFFVLVDLHGNKNTKKILADLNAVYLHFANNEGNKLIHALGAFNKECVNSAQTNMVNGDPAGLGKDLQTFQKNFDENIACFSDELRAPLLHKLIEFSCALDGVLACKGVGSQGDGMAQILVESEDNLKVVVEKIKNKFGFDCYELKVGQQYLNAIIPIAGMGTRMYPFTHIVDKALLPVIDSGKIYPAIMLILRELYCSERISHVDLIVNQSQHDIVCCLKLMLIDEKNDISLTETLQIKKGFGGALASSSFIQEPGFSIICLGDYIYHGRESGDCTRQLVDFWKKQRKSVVGIKAIDVQQTSSYGIVFGTWVDDGVLKIEKIVEKPKPAYVEEQMLLEYRGKKTAFAFFGEYIVDNDMLRKMSLSGENADIGLSEYLNEYSQTHPTYALVIEGTSFDLGNPQNYYWSFVEYGKDQLWKR